MNFGNEIVEGTSNSSSVQISNSYGMNGKYSALNNYGLSSFFGSWFI